MRKEGVLQAEIELVVPFFDVDMMEVVWHGHYVKYFEEARCALLDKLGHRVFAPGIRISERPHLAKGLASSPFDSDGLPTHDREVVQDGILSGYFLSVYTARKLGLAPTGNAGGSHNLTLASSLTRPEDDLDGMLRRLGTGLFVIELIDRKSVV